MICPKCQYELEDSANYCSRCGKKLNSTRNTDLWGFSYRKELQENKFLRAHLGEEDIKIFNKKISILAAIFGPFYMIYRRLWSQGFIIIILYILSYQYLPADIGILFRVGFNLFLGIRFNENYIEEMIVRINRLKKKNPNITEEELLLLCKNTPDTTNIGAIIVLILIYFILLALLQSKGVKLEDQVQEGMIDNNHISYQIPKETIIKTNYNNYQHFSYEENNKKCYVTIYSQYMTKNEKEYLVDVSNNHSNYKQSNTEEVTINNFVWLQKNFEKTSAYQDFYLMKYPEDGRIYEMRFDTSEKGSCESIKKIILDSLTYK